VTGSGQDAERAADPGSADPGSADPGSADEAGEQLAGFRSTSNGATARFAAAQAAIIRSLVGQLAELVGGEMAADEERDALPGSPDALVAQLGLGRSAELPDDPVLARLLPDAYRDDPEASGEFRRYTEQDLRSGKVAAARTVLATLPSAGGRVALSEPEAQAWLRALNDVRLALSVRLGVTEEFDAEVAEIDADDPRSAYVWVYQWLAYLQDSLIEALS
jgi:Domain of unknown function (DUF2017)